MAASHRAKTLRPAWCPSSWGAALVLAVFGASLGASLPVRAQQPPALPQARIVVSGEGSVAVAPDIVEIRSGVTTKGKTAKEATDANTKVMHAIAAALLDSGIEQKDIQTSRFSVQPVYTQQPNVEPKLAGFSVINQVTVTIRQIGSLGEILDRLVAAGATDVGNVEFLHADAAKALDQARAAAVADARRKAEIYARASGLSISRVVWIMEDSGYGPPVPMAAMRVGAAVPIAPGEDVLHARITVGFDISP